MSFPASVRKAVATRSGGVCEGCGNAPATEFHHRRFKSRGGKDTIENCLHLCGWGNHTGCHGAAHSADPPQGWAVHSWEDPKLIPVVIVGGEFWLTQDGRSVATGQGVEF